MLNKNDTAFNLSSYDRIILELSSNRVEGIGVSLFINDTSGVKYNEVCFYENLTINNKRNLYSINLSELKIPDWWYSITNTPLGKKFEPNFSSVNRINIGNANSTASDIQQSLKIYSICFERDNTGLAAILVLFEFVLFLLLFIIHNRKSSKSASVTITYKPINLEKENQQLNSYLKYINNNFHDPNLTLEQVSHETGISQRKIANAIQQDFSCNFKTYVNKLRINESKRLLLESELNKGEIAYKVGFSNQTNFNRVFKSLEGITPSKFLESRIT